MYCPSCGAESTFGLKYCKQCGDSLIAPTQAFEPLPASRLTGAIWALSLATAIVTICGLAIAFITASEMVGRPGVDTSVPIVVVIFGTLTILGVAAMLIRLLSRLLGAPQAVDRPVRKQVSDERRPAQIAAPPRVVAPSVTEHTTRTFDPARYTEPGVRE